MPRELILVGYKPNGPPALLVQSTEYATVRKEFEKLRSTGQMPKGFTMARLFDSENGFVTIYDEPTRRRGVHEASAKSAEADLGAHTDRLKAMEEEASGLKAGIDAMQKQVDEVEAKVQSKRPITDDEQGIRVLLPDKINAAKNAHGALLKKLEAQRSQHQAAQKRHEQAQAELAAFKESQK